MGRPQRPNRREELMGGDLIMQHPGIYKLCPGEYQAICNAFGSWGQQSLDDVIKWTALEGSPGQDAASKQSLPH